MPLLLTKEKLALARKLVEEEKSNNQIRKALSISKQEFDAAVIKGKLDYEEANVTPEFQLHAILKIRGIEKRQMLKDFALRMCEPFLQVTEDVDENGDVVKKRIVKTKPDSKWMELFIKMEYPDLLTEKVEVEHKAIPEITKGSEITSKEMLAKELENVSKEAK